MHPVLPLGRLQTPRDVCDWSAQMIDIIRHPRVLCKETKKRNTDQKNIWRLPLDGWGSCHRRRAKATGYSLNPTAH